MNMVDVSQFGRFDRLFVNGRFSAPADGVLMESVNPASGAAWTSVASASPEDVENAVDAADAAFHGAEWSGTTGAERGKLLLKLSNLIDEHSDLLAKVESTDNGKPITLCRADVVGAAAWIRYYSGLADKIHGEYIPLGASEWAYTVPQPLGVVAVIIPWNSPLLLAAWKLAPALAAGNTVVLKPSSHASASSLLLADLFQKAGFPKGIFNVVSGDGSKLGDALVGHPAVAKVSFTGSDVTARHVQRIASTGLKRTTMECGGKAPFIVFSDADIADAVDKSVQGMFVNAGQQCTVAARVLVQKAVFEEFLDRYLTSVSDIPVGDPSDPQTLVGAIVSQAQLAKIEGYVDTARKEGATFWAGGGRYRPQENHLRNGYWVEPTVLTRVKSESPVYQDEIFGPVVLLQPFEDESEAVKIANSVRYGLVSGVFTNDVRRAHAIAGQLEAGVVWVNTYRRIAPGFPYGGVKQSGVGSENGLEALRDYTRRKSVVMDNRN